MEKGGGGRASGQRARRLFPARLHADRHQVLAVLRLDVGGHLLNPGLRGDAGAFRQAQG